MATFLESTDLSGVAARELLFQNLRKEQKDLVKDLYKESFNLSKEEFDHKMKAQEINNRWATFLNIVVLSIAVAILAACGGGGSGGGATAGSTPVGWTINVPTDLLTVSNRIPQLAGGDTS